MQIQDGKIKCSECNQFADTLIYRAIGEENGVYTVCDICNKKQEVVELLEGDFDGDLITAAKRILVAGDIMTCDFSKQEGLKYDQNKPDHSLLPPEFLDEVAKAFMDGQVKYGRYNFTNGIKVTRLLGAALRHLNAYSWGEDVAEDSKLNHLGHSAASIAMALWMIKNKPEFDDRFKGFIKK